jgi:hypothetical protein
MDAAERVQPDALEQRPSGWRHRAVSRRDARPEGLQVRRFLRGLLWGGGGYLLGAVAGALLVQALSPNTHDLALEAPMTGAFVTGPLLGLIAFVAGALRTPREG